jgi:hypothetical protein
MQTPTWQRTTNERPGQISTGLQGTLHQPPLRPDIEFPTTIRLRKGSSEAGEMTR